MSDYATREVIKSLVVIDENGCWNWQGTIKPNGYGYRSNKIVHRLSYKLFVGPIPEGLHIDHLCRNRACCYARPKPAQEWLGRHRADDERIGVYA